MIFLSHSTVKSTEIAQLRNELKQYIVDSVEHENVSLCIQLVYLQVQSNLYKRIITSDTHSGKVKIWAAVIGIPSCWWRGAETARAIDHPYRRKR